MELKKVIKESRRIGFIILFLSVFMGFKPAIAQENIKEVELNVEDTTVFSMEEVELKPEFFGGDEALRKFLYENLIFPEIFRTAAIEGYIIIGFIVEVDGSLTNIEILKSPAKVLSDEAIRVVKLIPKWEPGKLNGKAVRVQFEFPVEFRLN